MQGVDSNRFVARIKALGEVGRDGTGALKRLAASDADKAGRDLFARWIDEAGLTLKVDRIGNMFGLWTPPGTEGRAPLLMGSHIDSVIDAGIYDGCTGVLAGLEVIETLKESGFAPARPLAVAAFTNEEGVRYAPDMLGSLVHAGGLSLDDALATIGTDGTRLGDELAHIDYQGDEAPGFLKPHAYLELHVEQGPVLDREGVAIGAVENLQGISWRRVTFSGVANHAGTTPMSMRNDAGYAAASVVTFLRGRASRSNTPTVATVGTIRFEPDAINVIPARATFTIDLRDPDEQRLREEEAALDAFLAEIAAAEGLTCTVEQLARFEPVTFDAAIVRRIEAAAKARGLSCRRMTSGAGHDAQMMARIAPAAMIFTPSVAGVSHNPREFTEEADLVAGANVLLDVARDLASS